MKSSKVRSQFLDYFKAQGHEIVASSSLIPENDPTLLFTNAGMNQFKDCFLGLEDRSYKRATTSQKCVRAGGKHNDLDNVGFTARHHTFFEMLGNFSFGEYFKKEAIHFAWELLTREFQIPKEKLYITVHETDDEAADIWHKQEGVPRDRIFKLGADNYWRMGDVGPCGPSSEIFYDHGAHTGKESDPFKGIVAGEDRFVEIWNLVFMQFEDRVDGTTHRLPKPSVDTGSGLERVCSALQGVANNYSNDLFWPLITRAAEISKQTDLLDLMLRSEKEGINFKASAEQKLKMAALRVLADHTRAASFLIADGALPANDGRGYVLRRILRRAVRFAQKLSGEGSFIPELSKTLITEMSQAYPELKTRENLILSTIKDEEVRFLTTLDKGLDIFNQSLVQIQKNKANVFSGETAFKLYDTYGFPLDLTEVMAQENNLKVDKAGFEQAMKKAKETAKRSWKGASQSLDQAFVHAQAAEIFKTHGKTKFLGYKDLQSEATPLLIASDTQVVQELKTGETGFVIFAQTPFYAEGGGQAGDQGVLTSPTATLTVLDTKNIKDVFVHFVHVDSGNLKMRDSLKMSVPAKQRRQVAANHSAAHLLHAALRKVLGETVAQAGQMVDGEKLRFDFTYPKALSSEQLQEIEALVLNEIEHSVVVSTELMTPEKAVQSGAIALFGEKYGQEVRVLSMGEFSKELCGGTHVSNTSQVLTFKIISESSVSSGVRRIEALAGEAAIHYLRNSFFELRQAKQAAQVDATSSSDESKLVSWIEQKKTQIKELEKEVKTAKSNSFNWDELEQSVFALNQKGPAAFGAVVFVDSDDRDFLSSVSDRLQAKDRELLSVVVGRGSDSRPTIVSAPKKSALGLNAGQTLKELAAKFSGKGGGRPDFAQGNISSSTDAGSVIQFLKSIK